MVRTRKDISKIDNGKEKEIEKEKKKLDKGIKNKEIDRRKENDDIKSTYSNEKNEGIQIIEVLETTKDNVTRSIKSAKNRNHTYLLFKAFLTNLKEDKLYFLSLIVTIFFFVFFSVNKLQDTDGYYDKKNEMLNANNNAVSDNSNKNNGDETQVKSDDVDVTSYVGIYSREVVLTSPVKVNNSCQVEDYKLVYEIKSNRNIAKYLVNSCLGTIKIWDGTLAYVSSGGARYISANEINFLFSASSMKEVDGETYKIDEDITGIKESMLLKNIEIYFNSNSYIVMTTNDLILIKGSSVGYQLSQEFNTISQSTNRTVFKTSTNGSFKFIAFSDKDNTKCLNEKDTDGIEEKELYKIYAIEFDVDEGMFNKEKEIVSRNNTAGCAVLEEDIASLNE